MSTRIKIANVILLGAGLLSLWFAAVVLYHYDWVRDRHFSNWGGAVLYHVVPIALAVAFLAALWLRPRARARVAACAVALVLSVFGAELLLRTMRPKAVEMPVWEYNAKWAEVVKEAAAESGVNFDPRSRAEVVADLRRQGVDAVPLATTAWRGNPRFEGLFPLAPMSNKMTVLGNDSGQWVVYRTDERGFNNPAGIWGLPHIRIVALGESFTEGYAVPPEQNYVARIRQVFPATLNLGFSGGPMLMWALMQEYVTEIKPDVVLWFHCEGIDLDDLWRQREEPVFQRYMSGDFHQGLIGRQEEIDRKLMDDLRTEERTPAARGPRDSWRASLRRLESVVKLEQLRQTLGFVYGKESRASAEDEAVGPANLSLFARILSASRARVASWGGTLVFVYQPSWRRFGTRSPLADEERAKVFATVRACGLTIIDTVPAFQAQDDPLSLFPFRRFGHFNEKGHQVIADAVLRHLNAPRTSSRPLETFESSR